VDWPLLPLALADLRHVSQFACVGSAKGLFHGHTVWRDEEGPAWAGAKSFGHAFGITSLGPGWMFDDELPVQKAAEVAKRLASMKRLTNGNQRILLREEIRRLRIGGLSERLLWLTHQAVLVTEASVVKLPDALIRQALWGHGPCPRHWRGVVTALLTSLTRLHLANWPDEGIPVFDECTVALKHAADLLRVPNEDKCDGDCFGYLGSDHHHFLVNVGRGFLGNLEQLLVDEADDVRYYNFDKKELRRIGKSGRLTTVFMPAKLGEPFLCRQFTAQQHRLLQCLVRETTRATRRKGSFTSEAEETTGNSVRSYAGKDFLNCSQLAADETFVGFNGTRKRKGLGYRLLGDHSWLARAGYRAGDVKSFLHDLGAVGEQMGLKVVGVGPKNTMFTIEQLRELAVSRPGRHKLVRIDVRVYTTADYIDRWKGFFLGSPAVSTQTPVAPTEDRIAGLSLAISGAGLSQRAVARGIGEDHSLFRKRLNGDKPMPAATLEKAVAFVSAARKANAAAAVKRFRKDRQIQRGSMLDEAICLLERGVCVLPQQLAEKKPHVRWTPYQTTHPTPEDLRTWFREWPDAGLAIVLGAVSDLFVIDVDGRDAHDVLLETLGREPRAPKVMSGNGDRYRYHLYFRCPSLPTKSKATPWHANLEFRGERGIVIAPPSLHESGNRYTWAKGRSLDDLPLREPPEAVLTSLMPVPVKTNPVPTVAYTGSDAIDASRRTKQFLAGNFSEGPGWNAKLFLAACDLCGRNVPIHVAEPVLLAGAKPWNVGEQQLVQRTIQSAYSQPREPGYC
jgi:hypothetical protein